MTVQQLADGLVGLAPIEVRPPIGKMPNAQHQTFHGFMSGAPYELAIVEFDDQGRCYDRAQMEAVGQRLETLTDRKEDVILLAFVHGWKHDARSDDPNLTAFRALLTKTVQHEHATTPPGTKARPVLGVFIGWRGLSEYGLGDAVADATFWGRQAAGQRVATGSVRELYGRLRHYRNARGDNGGSPLLVIAGHSFGGMVVFSALAQSLIEAASAPSGEVVPRFADLVLLVNPAIEGARYIPIQDLVSSPAFKQRTQPQLPVFICAQAENDQPVGTFFPIGNIGHRLDQATIGDLEKDCVTHAIGFVPTFRTHALSGPAGGDPFKLTPASISAIDPFWVVGATKEVIDGHGGIWQQPFLQFLAAVVLQHVQVSQDRRAAGAPQADETTSRRMPKTTHATGDLASFAREIGPLELPRR